MEPFFFFFLRQFQVLEEINPRVVTALAKPSPRLPVVALWMEKASHTGVCPWRPCESEQGLAFHFEPTGHLPGVSATCTTCYPEAP